MRLIQRFHEMHAAIEERQKSLYWLLAACLYLALFVALPISLTGFEENVDGLKGYPSFFLGLALGGAVLGAARSSAPK